jgi:predicted phosphodiesterase
MKLPETMAFISDIHYHEHDVVAEKLMLKVLRENKPDMVMLGGDIFDGHALGRWKKHPKEKLSLKDEINSVVEGLSKLRAAVPNAVIKYFQGNHDERLQSYLWEKAEELHDLDVLQLDKLFEFAKFDIQLARPLEGADSIRPVKMGHLYMIHGHEPKMNGKYAHERILDKFQVNIMFGHFHRFAMTMRRRFNGELVGAWGNGTLERLDVAYDACPQWHQGFTFVHFAAGGLFQVEPALFLESDGGRYLSTRCLGKMHKVERR